MIKILGGDFGEDKSATMKRTYFSGKFHALVIRGRGWPHTIRRKDIQSVEAVNDKNKVNVLGALGGGAVGGLLAGGFGLLAGAVLAGRGKAVLLVVHLKDGRQFLCSANPKEYELLLAAAMDLDPVLRAVQQLAQTQAAPPQPVYVQSPFSQPPAMTTNVQVGGQSPFGYARPRWSRLVAALLSLMVPGLGQMYKGRIINGVVWLIVVVIGYVALVISGLILHFCCIIGAASGDPYRR
ncbi:MAG TPA: hypothetical protein VMV69_09305 [Pirellulales bacterium]|nr:hypothetical protein [Pirellulales bacterium]